MTKKEIKELEEKVADSISKLTDQKFKKEHYPIIIRTIYITPLVWGAIDGFIEAIPEEPNLEKLVPIIGDFIDRISRIRKYRLYGEMERQE